MSDLFDRMRTLGERLPSQVEHLDSLEATKHALVLPIFQALGYNVFDTSEFLPAPGPDLVGIAPPDGPDFLALQNGTPVFLVECRKPDDPLLPIPATRSAACFPLGTAPLVIYTNGIQVQVHTDLSQPGRLDIQPVMSFDLNDFRDEDAILLPWLAKGSFEAAAFRKDAADVSRFFPALVDQAERELAAPSQELVTLLASRVYHGPVPPEIDAELGRLVRKAFKKLITDRIRERLILAISLDGPPEDRVEEVERMLSPTMNLDAPPARTLLASPLEEEVDASEDHALAAPRSSGSSATTWVLGLVLLGLAGWGGWKWLARPTAPAPEISSVSPPPAAPPVPVPAATGEPAPATSPSPGATAASPAPAPAEKNAKPPHLACIEAGDLAGAAELGRQKLSALDKEHWTLRLDIAYESTTVVNLVKSMPGQEESCFLLPIRMKDGRTCYQVFLGDFPTESAALAKRAELPAWYTRRGNAPIPFKLGALPEQQ